MIYFFNLDPNDVQVVFLESMEIPYYAEENSENKDLPRDPFYDIYKKMISRGGEPIYIKNLIPLIFKIGAGAFSNLSFSSSSFFIFSSSSLCFLSSSSFSFLACFSPGTAYISKRE